MLTPIRALLIGSLGLLVGASTVGAQTQGQPNPQQPRPSQRAQAQQASSPASPGTVSPGRIQRLPAPDQRDVGAQRAVAPPQHVPGGQVRRAPARNDVVQTAAEQPVQRMANGAVPAGGVPAMPGSQDPFRLTAEQQAQVDQVLQLWETESDKISTYKCSFDRFEYDSVFLEGGELIATSVSKGQISYVKPDKGRFKITAVERYNAKTQVYEKQEGDPNEHWVCTGDAVYEYDATKKQLNKFEIPPEQQGKAIADGPLPFVFGAEAEKLKQRYWIRIIPMNERPEPSSEEAASDIWLDVRPKRQADAANYSRLQVILSRSEFLPKALQKYSPSGNQRTSYVFGKASVNSFHDKLMMIVKPSKPFGWKLVVEKAPVQAASPAPNHTAAIHTGPNPTGQSHQATRNEAGSQSPR